MSTFLGIGLGPIQTGIFISGAAKGAFGRIVIADVDEKLCSQVRNASGELKINIATDEKVFTESFHRIEIYNPTIEKELEILIGVAAEADEISTALPSVKFFPHIAGWMKKGFSAAPLKRRFIYCSENNNHAAEILMKEIGAEFPETYFLNTVIGKMSGILSAEECDDRKFERLCKNADRGHLVEEFNRILISSCPGIEKRSTAGLHAKPDLIPFEEAKLYGHNAIHVMLGLKAAEKGIEYMCQLRQYPEILEDALDAFVNESGKALCSKWKGTDQLFTESGFKSYAEDLIRRMTNPFLNDRVDRICRDLNRKLGWEDRIIGTIRLALSENVPCPRMIRTAKFAASAAFGQDLEKRNRKLLDLWLGEGAQKSEAENMLGQVQIF